ncbi:MAG: histidine kinase [Pontixanthobacter sp.]
MKTSAAQTPAREKSARVSLRTVLVSIAALWASYFVLTTIRGSIVGLDLQFELVWRRALVTAAGAAITMALWLCLRLFDARPLWVKICVAVMFALPAAGLVAMVNQLAFAAVQADVAQRMAEQRGVAIREDQAGNIFLEVPSDPDAMPVNAAQDTPREVLLAPASARGGDGWRLIVDIAIGRYFLLLAWASLYFALLAVKQTQLAERREADFRRQAKEAELRSLRYQVNPHFLFNALNSLSALVMTGKADRAEEMIQTLSNFYRHSLADETSADVDLADEIALQNHYLAIEQVRFPNRLVARIDCPAGLENARVPGMILQPLVENSVKYAVAPSREPVTITICAYAHGDRLVLKVSDDGPGAGDIAQGGFGIGLANIRDRLRARFGDAAEIEAGPTDSGYCSEIRMPLILGESRFP